jgi:hypothetical protein
MCIFIKFYFVDSIEKVSEMLEKGIFLLKLSLRWVVTEFIRSNCIGFVSLLLLDVLEVFTVLVNNDLDRIIEIDSSRSES